MLARHPKVSGASKNDLQSCTSPVKTKEHRDQYFESSREMRGCAWLLALGRQSRPGPWKWLQLPELGRTIDK